MNFLTKADPQAMNLHHEPALVLGSQPMSQLSQSFNYIQFSTYHSSFELQIENNHTKTDQINLSLELRKKNKRKRRIGVKASPVRIVQQSI